MADKRKCEGAMSVDCALALLQMDVPDKEVANKRFKVIALKVHPDKIDGHTSAFLIMKEAREVVTKEVWRRAQQCPRAVPKAVPKCVPRPAPQFAASSDGRGRQAAASRGEPGYPYIPSRYPTISPPLRYSERRASGREWGFHSRPEWTTEGFWRFPPRDVVIMSWWIALRVPSCDRSSTWKEMIDEFIDEFSAEERTIMSRQGAVRLNEVPLALRSQCLIVSFELIDGCVMQMADIEFDTYAAVFDKVYHNAIYNSRTKADFLTALLGAARILLDDNALLPPGMIEVSGLPELRAARNWVENQVIESMGGRRSAAYSEPDPEQYLELLALVKQDGDRFIIEDRTCPHCGRKAFGKSVYLSKDAIEQAAWTHNMHYCY
jgi:hypothetical protein